MVLALLGGLTNVVDMPTRQAFSVEMVGREDIGNAVALNSAMFNAARVLGPAAAGLTIGAFDISDRLPHRRGQLPRRPDRAARDARQRAPHGRRRSRARARSARCSRSCARASSYVRRTPLVLLGVTVVGLVATFGMNFQVRDPAAHRAGPPFGRDRATAS